MNIVVVHGPNLNLLGTREPDKYGAITLVQITDRMSEIAGQLGVKLESFQSNSEGDLVTFIQTNGSASDGIVINPAAYTHTSVAIRDALIAAQTPCVEVHLTNTYAREPFRHRSLIADIVVARIMGFGAQSYYLGLSGLVEYLRVSDQ